METTLKHYTGTKTVQAQAMTLSEYMGRPDTDRNRNSQSAAYIEEDGYMVKFEDGYTTWSPKEDFEKAYRCSETYVDRMAIEKEQLDERLDKLCKFIEDRDLTDMQIGKRNLIIKQLKVMSMLGATLTARLNMERYDEAVAGVTDKAEKDRIGDEFTKQTKKEVDAYSDREKCITGKYINNLFVDLIGAIYHEIKKENEENSQSK